MPLFVKGPTIRYGNRVGCGFAIPKAVPRQDIAIISQTAAAARAPEIVELIPRPWGMLQTVDQSPASVKYC